MPTTSGACITDVYGASRWAGLELQATQDWLGNDRLSTMVGVEGRVRGISASTATIDGATNQTLATVGDASVTEVPAGVYLQQRWNRSRLCSSTRARATTTSHGEVTTSRPARR